MMANIGLQAMYLPGRLAPVHLAIVVCILYHHPEHSLVLPSMLSAAHDERVRQVGEARGRGVQCHSRQAVKQHGTWWPSLDRVHGQSKGARQEALCRRAGLSGPGWTRCCTFRHGGITYGTWVDLELNNGCGMPRLYNCITIMLQILMMKLGDNITTNFSEKQGTVTICLLCWAALTIAVWGSNDASWAQPMYQKEECCGPKSLRQRVLSSLSR